MSANSAVTVLRSPSGIPPTAGSVNKSISETDTVETGVDALVDIATALGASGAPHWPQNLEPGLLSNPHLGQRALSIVPHWLQNLRPSAFSVPQVVQRIPVVLNRPARRGASWHP